jgi:protease-4
MAAAPRRSAAGRFVVAMLALLLMGSVLLNLVLLAVSSFSSYDPELRITEKRYSHARYATQKVGIIDIDGVILSGEGSFKRQIDYARTEAEEGRLKALVLRVDSPGGSVSGSDYIFHHLRKFREDTGLPIVVSMGGVAASGGYYVSMAVGDAPNTIFAEPSTFTGSIGVIIPHYNAAGLFEKIGVEADAVASHPLKTMGSLSRKMTAEEQDIFLQLVNDGFEQFKDVIKQGRPKFRNDPSALDKLATGQIFSSKQALDAGLVDKIGFLEDAIERAIELAGVEADYVTVVRFKPESGLLDALMGAQARPAAGLDLAALLDMSTPRTYYLWTALPPLARSGQ